LLQGVTLNTYQNTVEEKLHLGSAKVIKELA